MKHPFVDLDTSCSVQSVAVVSEVVGIDEDRKRMSPCPLYTVHLNKPEAGIGLALVDGLVWPCFTL